MLDGVGHCGLGILNSVPEQSISRDDAVINMAQQQLEVNYVRTFPTDTNKI